MKTKTAITKSSPALLRVEEACALLSKCRTIDEAKGIRDKAEAIKAYLRTQSASLDAQNDAAEIKLRAERRLGELLAEQKAKGERDAGKGGNRRSRLHDATVNPPKLADLGIEKTAASRWQQLAKIPEPRFEAYVKEQRATPQGEITSAGIRHEHKVQEKEIRRTEQRAQVRAYVPPTDEYAVISVDYSWPYEDELDGEGARGGLDYPTMTIEEICAFPIPAAADCALFCWVTNSHLIEPEHFAVVARSLKERYGFVPKQIRTWRKVTNDGEKERIGGGRVWRNNTEHLVRFERGRPVYNAVTQSTCFDAPRGKPSEKPDKAYEDIKALCASTSRLEMFARKPRAGWVTSGSELPAETGDERHPSEHVAGSMRSTPKKDRKLTPIEKKPGYEPTPKEVA